MESQHKKLVFNQYKNQGVAVVTSGGDSQGMNAALRAIVRIGLYLGCKIFYIREGYEGLIAGNENITEATWNSVSSIIQKGGTVIGSARSERFMTPEGKLKSVKNLVKRGITNLIVIGGDGSLTGAMDLKNQWSDVLNQLEKSGEISKEEKERYNYLNVVGLIGTIDNDFPGTNMTIGTDSALHRILEAVNALESTAYSHRRTFILEVMGRHCGYLALKTAMTTEADYVFVPEMPPPLNWPAILKDKITTSTRYGKRLHLIVLAEGAIDLNGNPITALMVKKIVTENMGLDARITVLGHVQRGGSPSAYDRILASRQAAAAVVAVLELKPDDRPIVVTVESNEIKLMDLQTCIENVKKLQIALKNLEFNKVLELRGKSFINNFKVFQALNKLHPYSDTKTEKVRTFAILQVGTPACGVNAAVFSFVRHCLHRGGRVYGISGGLHGLFEGNFNLLTWSDVNGFVFEGGSYLGMKRVVLSDCMCPKVAEVLEKFGVEGLLIIGGFEAFSNAYVLMRNRENFSQLCIPIAVIPATINNNVPGSEFAIGADTALNVIAKSCDLFRQSAMGTKSRVFVVETMGGRCGYLCSIGALVSGADSSYIFEEPFNLNNLQKDVQHMISKMKHGKILRGLILRNEKCNENYSLDFIAKIFAEEGKDVFSTKKNVLGHIQQGDIPTSFDRSLGIKLSARAVEWFYEQFEIYKNKEGKIYSKSPNSVVVIGLYGNKECHTTLEELIPNTDFEHRLYRCQWWLNLRWLFKILALHESNYNVENNIIY